MIFKECGLWKRSNFFLYALAAISFEKFERNLKDDWKKLYFKVVEISAALFQVHLEHYLTISSKFDVSATVGNLSLASWWRNKNRRRQTRRGCLISRRKCENVGPASYKEMRTILHFIVWTLQLRPHLFQTSSNWGQTFGIGKSAQNWKKCAKLAERTIECEPISTTRAKILY